MSPDLCHVLKPLGLALVMLGLQGRTGGNWFAQRAKVVWLVNHAVLGSLGEPRTDTMPLRDKLPSPGLPGSVKP